MIEIGRLFARFIELTGKSDCKPGFPIIPFANKFLVFQSLRLQLPLLLKEAAMFVGCRLSTGGISVAIMYLCVDLFGLNQFIAKIYVSAFSLISNYFLSKLLVFKKKKEEK